MIRTFIAIEIPAEIKQKIVKFQESINIKYFPVRWTKAQNMHITLKFIGEIEENLVDKINKELMTPPPLSEPFEISISGTGVFPNPQKPRVMWTGIRDGVNKLTDLSKKVENILLEYGISKEERNFKPHLTIGRFRGRLKIEDNKKYFSPDLLNTGSFEVSEILFVKSILNPTGAEYSNIGVHSLI